MPQDLSGGFSFHSYHEGKKKQGRETLQKISLGQSLKRKVIFNFIIQIDAVHPTKRSNHEPRKKLAPMIRIVNSCQAIYLIEHSITKECQHPEKSKLVWNFIKSFMKKKEPQTNIGNRNETQ